MGVLRFVAAWLVAVTVTAAAQTYPAPTTGSIPVLFGKCGTPLAGAQVDLNFATGQSIINGSCGSAAQQITTVRAISGTGHTLDYAADASGNYIGFGANVPRITNAGLLVEESRTNSLRNNSMQGAVAGSPGTLPTNWAVAGAVGLTTNVIATGIENGISYIDLQITGTTSGTAYKLAFETYLGIAASQSQVWTLSIFHKLVGGSLTNITATNLEIDEANAGGGGLAANIGAVAAPTATLQRVTYTATLGNAATAHVTGLLNLTVTNSSAVNATIRIGWPQLELGSFATSPIVTTSAAVTRNADVVTLTSPPVFGSAYTLFAQWVLEGLLGSQTALEVYADAGNRTFIRTDTAGGASTFRGVGGTGFATANGPVSVNSVIKIAGAAAASDQAAAKNGAAVSTASAASLPSTPTTVALGVAQNGSFFADGTISRIAIWPTTRLPNSTLQAITQ
jgi:hypothetical protein